MLIKEILVLFFNVNVKLVIKTKNPEPIGSGFIFLVLPIEVMKIL